MKYKNIFKLVTCIVVAELAGVLGSAFSYPSIPGWYRGIIKPSFAPPNWVFGPVWTTLFLLVGIALYLVWTQKPQLFDNWSANDKRAAISIFIIQLFLNTLWSIIFFGFQSPGAAFLEILFLWAAIFTTIVLFYRITKLAAYLLVPYLAWVTFASLLNYFIWQLN